MNTLRIVLVTCGVLTGNCLTKWYAVLLILLLAAPGTAQHAHLLIVANRTLIDNEFIFGLNAASPPTLGARQLEAGQPLLGMGRGQSKFISSAAGGILSDNPNLTFIGAGLMVGTTTVTFADVGPTGDTITRSSGNWLDDYFAAGQSLTITGTSSNNISNALIADVTETKITLDTTELANESLSLTGSQVASTGTPGRIIRSAGSWVTDGFAAEQRLYIKKDGSSNNLVQSRIASITTTTNSNDTITITDQVLADEGPANGHIVRSAARAVSPSNFGSGTNDDGRHFLTGGITVDGGQSFQWFDTEEVDKAPFLASFIADGIVSDGNGAELNNVEAINFRGTGMACRIGGVRFYDCVSANNWTGLAIRSSDCEVSRTQLIANRDFGLWIWRDCGNTQVEGCHIFGARVAVWDDGGRTRFVGNNTFADARCGLVSDGFASGGLVDGALFQHNTAADLVVMCPSVTVADSRIDAQLQIDNGNLDVATKVPYHTGSFALTVSGNYSIELRSGANDFRCSNCRLLLDKYKHPIAHTPTGTARDLVHMASGVLRARFENVSISDGDGLSGNDLWTMAGTVQGLYIRATLNYTPDASDRLLKFQAADGNDVEALDIVIEGPGLDTDNPGNLIDLEDNWTGSILLRNTTTGAESEIDEGAEL